MPALIDLSHTIHDGLVTFKGLPAPVVCDYLSREASRANYEGGTEFQIGRIEMVTNTGTYIDCPFHRYGDGKDLNEGLAQAQGIATDFQACTANLPAPNIADQQATREYNQAVVKCAVSVDPSLSALAQFAR